MKGLLKSTVRSVSRLFGRDHGETAEDEDIAADGDNGTEQPPARRPSQKAPIKQAGKAPRIDSRKTLAEMDQIIERMVAKHGKAVAGRVQFLRFEDILNSVGPKRATRLANAIEGIVRKYVGPGDVLRRMGEGVFVLIFGGIDKDEAEAKCALIRDDVNKFAEGDPNLKGKLEVSTVVAELDGAMKLQNLESFDEVFDRLEAGQTTEDPSAESKSDPAPAENSEDTVNAASFEDWDKWLDIEWSATPEGAPDGKPDSADEDDPKWRDIVYGGSDLSSTATPEESTVDVASLRRHLETASVAARPVWDINRKTLTGVACVPVQNASGTVLSADALGANPSGVVTLSLDRLAVTWAASQLSKSADEVPALIVIPVHFASLASMRNRSLLFSAFLEFKPDWRARVLGEVTFPDDIHMAAVEDIIRLFQPFVGQVGVSCGLNWRYFANLRGWGAHWAGFSLAGDTDHDEAAIIDAMANFATGAADAGLVPYAKDLPTRNLVMAAAAVGIRHVFAAPTAAPGAAPWQFRLDDLYPR